jgi:hypothetical protein
MRQQAVDSPLADRQPCLPAQRALHGLSVQFLIALDAEGSNRRAFTRIDDAELDAGLVGIPCHLSTQRINFLYQMSLGDASNRRIARHLRNAILVHREEQGVRTHARCGQRSFTAGMTSAHHNNVDYLSHGNLSLFTDAEL